MAPAPRLALGEDIAWARWLPDGKDLIVGGATGGGDLVASATLSAQPLVTARGHEADRGNSLDINYTVVIIPPRP